MGRRAADGMSRFYEPDLAYLLRFFPTEPSSRFDHRTGLDRALQLARLLLPRANLLFRRSLLDRCSRRALYAFGLDAPPQRIHEVDDLRRRALLRRFDLLVLLSSRAGA
jgi:hypothetical protein